MIMNTKVSCTDFPVGTKEKQLLEKDTLIKTLNEKLAMTSEQLKLMQENFVQMEGQWKQEKSQLQVIFQLVSKQAFLTDGEMVLPSEGHSIR